jgi:hypothetical protein
MEFDESEVFIDVEIEFSTDDKDYFWVGSYEVHQYGEESTWDCMGMIETEINILGTIRLCVNDGDDWIDITPTRDVMDGVIEQIIRKL